MSRRSSHYYQNEYSGHGIDARLYPVTTAAGRRGGDYTFVVAGRQLRLGPIAFWALVGALVVMGVWTITTATYFAFREDVLTRLIARQANMQFGYEDRIAELRTQVDRISSRQLLDQEQYEQKLEQILRRQAALESRASALSGLPDPTPTGSIRPTVRGGTERTLPLKPSPLSDKGAFLVPSERDARGAEQIRLTTKTAGGVDGALARLQASLDLVERRQDSTLNSLEETMNYKARRIRGVLADLGVDNAKIATASAGAIGGPFIPVRPSNDANTFERQLSRIKLARSHVERLTRTLSAIPVRKPLSGELDVSSSFGVRSDPFTRSAAMHTGLDFHGVTGEPVRATANGTVTAAGWSGGYGKVVDVDHGNGFSTRYGHLSEIDVKVGQAVKIGQTVGRVGSTGRSTGPHLHYETRVGNEAVDPEKFLRAGVKLDGHL